VAALIEALDVKRRTFFELDNVPYLCLEAEVSTPTARGGQTLVRLKMLMQTVQASYLYRDNEGAYFLDQESFETINLPDAILGNALDFLIEGSMIDLLKFNGNPIGLELPPSVELAVAYTEPGVRGDTSSGSVTKLARLETGLEIKVPLFIKEGETVKVSTETREFGGRA